MPDWLSERVCRAVDEAGGRAGGTVPAGGLCLVPADGRCIDMAELAKGSFCLDGVVLGQEGLQLLCPPPVQEPVVVAWRRTRTAATKEGGLADNASVSKGEARNVRVRRGGRAVPEVMDVGRPDPVANAIRVEAWNVGGPGPFRAGRLGRVAEGAAALDAGLCFLSEVNPLSRFAELSGRLAERVGCLDHFSFDHEGTELDTGFLVRCELVVSEAGVIDGSDLNRPGYREAAYLKARWGKFDFVVVGLHLKSSRGSTNRLRRSEQLGYVRWFIGSVLGRWGAGRTGDRRLQHDPGRG